MTIHSRLPAIHYRLSSSPAIAHLPSSSLLSPLPVRLCEPLFFGEAIYTTTKHLPPFITNDYPLSTTGYPLSAFFSPCSITSKRHCEEVGLCQAPCRSNLLNYEATTTLLTNDYPLSTTGSLLPAIGFLHYRLSSSPAIAHRSSCSLLTTAFPNSCNSSQFV